LLYEALKKRNHRPDDFFSDGRGDPATPVNYAREDLTEKNFKKFLT
jgi:hypothetical protein